MNNATNPQMPQDDHRYHAFISYSHRDKQWGDWLHRSLETYRVPKRLVGSQGRDGAIAPRLKPVFRDREELPTSADLGSVIEQALRDSQYLIVICSPRAAKSRWVNEEILAFKRMGKANRILAVIIDGEPNASDKGEAFSDTECFPDALRFEVDASGNMTDQRTEPIAADARPQGDGKRDAKLKLLAGLLGVGFDSLKQRELQRRQRRLASLAVAATVLLAITTTLAVFAFISRSQAIDAQVEADTARKLSDQRERESRSQLVRTLEGNGHQQYNNGDIPLAMLWYAESLRVMSEATETTKADKQREAFSRIRMKYLIDSMPQAIAGIAHDDRITSIEIDAKHKRFATISRDHTVRVWNASTGEPVSPPLQHSSYVYTARFTHDGKSVVTSSFDHHLRFWNIQTGELDRPAVKHDVPAQDPNAAGVIATTPTYFTPMADDQWMTFDQSHLHLWKITANEAERIWTSETRVNMFIPDRQGVRAILRSDSDLYIWDMATRKRIATLKVSNPESKRIEFSGNGGTFGMMDILGGLESYRSADGQKLIGIPTPRGTLNTITVSPSGLHIVAGYEAGGITLYNLHHAMRFGLQGAVQHWNAERPIIALDMNPNETRFLAVTDRQLLIHDPGSFSSIPPRIPSGRLARWTSGETIVTSGFDDQGVGVLWHVTDHRPGVAVTLDVFGDRPIEDDQEREPVNVQQVAYDATGNHLYASSVGSTLWRFDRASDGVGQWTGKEQLRAPHGKQPFRSTAGLQFTPNKGQLFVGFDSNGFLLDTAKADASPQMIAGADGVYAARFTADGQRLLIVGDTSKLLDISTIKSTMNSIAGIPGGGVNASADLSPDGRFVVTTANRFQPMSSKLQRFDGQTGKPMPWSSSDADSDDAPDVDENGAIPFTGHLAKILIAPSSDRVAVSHDFDIHFRDLKTGKRVGPTLRRAGVPIAYNRAGNKLLTLFSKVQEDAKYGYVRENIGYARIWDIKAGEPITAPMEHNLVMSATFSHDESMVLTAGGRDVALWSALDGQPIVPMLSHTEPVIDAVFAPNDREIAVASDRVYIWTITPDHSLVKELVARAEVMSGKTIDQTGAAVPASNTRLREQWKLLKGKD